MELYEQVTNYVKEQMGKALQILEGKKKASVGFALTSLQRRLASSPEAIYMSLERRLARMTKLLDELDNRNICFALSNVLIAKGKKNEILESWLNKNQNYICHHLEFTYKNSNYQRKNKTDRDDEVLITNY